MPDSNRRTAGILFAVITIIWGTSFILIKQGLKVFSPDEVGALRVTAASLFLLPMAFTRLKELNSSHYSKLFLQGMMGIFIPAFLFALAQTRMESSIAGVMNTLTPIFTMIVGAVLFKQRFRVVAIAGIILGFAGAVLLSMSRTGGTLGGINLYALLIVLACFFYGANLNLIKFKIPDLSALTITSVSLLLVGPLAAIYLVGFTEFVPKLKTQPGAWQALGFVVLLGLMSTSVAMLLFNRLVKISTPLFASSVTYAIPLVAVLWGVLDGERLSLGHFAGMATIIGGVYLANRK
jgi:drug/metabolite transporter (DMT)-like permease